MIQLSGFDLTLDQVWQIANGAEVGWTAAARSQVQHSRDYIDGRTARGDVMYGVNTGFGAFANKQIPSSDIAQLQVNLIRSHACGVGAPFTRDQTRAIMALRANTLARGNSGVRPLVVDKVLEFINKNICPWIPSQGSVGASGDLAPLAHLALALIGEGEVWGDDDKPIPVASVLKAKGIVPLELSYKEGLSLINGCQVMTASGLLDAARIAYINLLCDVAGALSLEALRGSRQAFHPAISRVRPHPGEHATAKNLMKILGAHSTISESHKNCGRVQDAYSLRCMPAVHGMAKQAWSKTKSTLIIEANSSTDNPLVFAEEDMVVSCGNFHGAPVAFALDALAIAVATQANMSQCRLEKLINPSMSDLPAFLAPNGGLNSGHMIVQVAAASLVSENKIHTHPASVDTIPTSADKEDHVSMGTIAARKLSRVVDNAEYILAMELLSAAQGLDLLRPLQPAAGVQTALHVIRQVVPFADQDRVFGRDVEAIHQLIRSNHLLTEVQKTVGPLQNEED